MNFISGIIAVLIAIGAIGFIVFIFFIKANNLDGKKTK
jgi:hypothetical protein